jgi:hypothetical protein
MKTLKTIDLVSLEATRGGLVRSSYGNTNFMLQQQMMMISDSLRDVARSQNQMNPMMIAMLGLALARG